MKTKEIYIVAEIGGNFTNFEQAALMIDQAVECGVNAVKLQTYRAETISNSKAVFDMESTGIISQVDFFKKYEIDEQLHMKIFDYAKKLGVDIFSTPSHYTDVEMLEKLGASAFKIGADDAVNIPFIAKVAKLNKPIILSTGMCTLEEVKESVNVILATGNNKLTLLHAVSAYPAHDSSVNLNAIKTLKQQFPNLNIGYSDHSIGITACICAAAMGASMIEKHFTYDKQAEGPDHMISADKNEMKTIVDMIRTFEIMKGSGIKMPDEAEIINRNNNRKSITVISNIKKGEKITEHNIDIKRPGTGIMPKYYYQILGKTASNDLKVDDILEWGDFY